MPRSPKLAVSSETSSDLQGMIMLEFCLLWKFTKGSLHNLVFCSNHSIDKQTFSRLRPKDVENGSKKPVTIPSVPTHTSSSRGLYYIISKCSLRGQSRCYLIFHHLTGHLIHCRIQGHYITGYSKSAWWDKKKRGEKIYFGAISQE